jgi:hypothetical protein
MKENANLGKLTAMVELQLAFYKNSYLNSKMGM